MLRILSPTLSRSITNLHKNLPLPSRHHHPLYSSSRSASSNMDLKTIVGKLEEIAPSRRAESWDNVGLLVEPRQDGLISRVLLTNDLTEPVMDEAEKGEKIGLILSYHPPIFRPLKRITQRSDKERIILRAVQSGIAVYSPHTALDPVINQWLLSGLGEGETTSLGVGKIPSRQTNHVQLCNVAVDSVRDFCDSMKIGEENVTVFSSDHERYSASILCDDVVLAQLLPKLKEDFPKAEISVKSNEQFDVHPRGGMKLSLSKPRPLSELVSMVKQHLNLSMVRLASPFGKEEDPVIKMVATCAGSGGSVLSGVTSDLYLTGEMSHHEVLGACSRGTAVILCEHTNTERGFLHQVYKKQLETALGGQIEIVIAQNDRDPLKIV